MVKKGCVLLKQLSTQNGNKFELLFKLWDYFVLSIKVTTNHGVTQINLLCKFTSKDYFYPKNKFEEVTEKNINVLYTEMQGYYIKFKNCNFEKTLKINQSNPISWQ